MLAFLIGILPLTTVISLSGWTTSKSVGWFTTATGILTLILIFSTMIQVGT